MTSKPHPEQLEPIVLEPCQFCSSNKIEILRCAKTPARAGAIDVWCYCRGCSASGPHAPDIDTAVQFWNLGKPAEKGEAST